jgi:hypothetical protein
MLFIVLFLLIILTTIMLTYQLRQIHMAPECLQDLSNNSSEKRDSSTLAGSHTEGNASPKDDDPMNPEAFFYQSSILCR